MRWQRSKTNITEPQNKSKPKHNAQLSTRFLSSDYDASWLGVLFVYVKANVTREIVCNEEATAANTKIDTKTKNETREQKEQHKQEMEDKQKKQVAVNAN